MKTIDFLKPDDQVKVTVYGPDDKMLYQNEGAGFHSIQSAITAAVGAADLNVNPEDCVFNVSNLTSGVTHRYRINAHGNLKLIV